MNEKATSCTTDFDIHNIAMEGNRDTSAIEVGKKIIDNVILVALNVLKVFLVKQKMRIKALQD